jgi:rubrerythrin
MHITQILEAAIAAEIQASADMYTKYADDAREDNLPHLAEWFTDLARRSNAHKKSFEDLLKYYDNTIPHAELRADW